MRGPYKTETGLGDKGRATSAIAGAKAAGRAAALRATILARLDAAGVDGLTPEECAALLGEDISSVRPRFSELSLEGRITAQRCAFDLRRKERRRSRLGGLSTVMVAARFERRASPVKEGKDELSSA